MRPSAMGTGAALNSSFQTKTTRRVRHRKLKIYQFVTWYDMSHNIYYGKYRGDVTLPIAGQRSAGLLRHKDAVKARVVTSPGFDKAEPRVKRDVLRHRLMRVEPHFVKAEAPRFSLGECNQGASQALTLTVAAHRDIVEQQMAGLWQKHDDRGDLAVVCFKHADGAGGDQRRVVVEHRAR